jgi:protoporphyrinogen oxidase
LDGCVVRQSKAYPVYDKNYHQHVEIIRREIEDKFPTLYVVGRNGMHQYNNQDHAVMTAMLTVKNILAGKGLYAEYPKAGVAGADQGLQAAPEQLGA